MYLWPCCHNIAPLSSAQIVLEQLYFTVPPKLLPRYFEADNATWTSFLSGVPGFLGKEVSVQHSALLPALKNANVTVRCVVCWASYVQWKAIPPSQLAAVDAAFTKAMGSTILITQSTAWDLDTTYSLTAPCHDQRR